MHLNISIAICKLNILVNIAKNHVDWGICRVKKRANILTFSIRLEIGRNSVLDDGRKVSQRFSRVNLLPVVVLARPILITTTQARTPRKVCGSADFYLERATWTDRRHVLSTRRNIAPCMIGLLLMMRMSALWKMTLSVKWQWLTKGGWKDEWKEQGSMECCHQTTWRKYDH